MVGIHRLLKIGKTVGIHCLVKKLAIWWISTAYSKIGNMAGIRQLFKIGETVGIHRIVEIFAILWISAVYSNW